MMTKLALIEKAERFLALHQGPPILVLPNVWDVATAKLFEQEGFPALGTTSGGISASLGYPDGEGIPLCENVSVVSRIARAVRIPVSADIEAGYGRLPEAAARAALAMVRVGAVGVNLEDSASGCGKDPTQPLIDVGEQARRIIAIRAMAKSKGIPLVINARTDTYLLADKLIEDRFSETVRRATAYLEAGADCIFIPDTGILGRETIAELVRAIHAPINVIAGAGTPPIQDLELLGVARVSFGPRPMRACLGLLRGMAREWREAGTYVTMTDTSITYDEVNRWFFDSSGARTPKPRLGPPRSRK